MPSSAPSPPPAISRPPTTRASVRGSASQSFGKPSLRLLSYFFVSIPPFPFPTSARVVLSALPPVRSLALCFAHRRLLEERKQPNLRSWTIKFPRSCSSISLAYSSFLVPKALSSRPPCSPYTPSGSPCQSVRSQPAVPELFGQCGISVLQINPRVRIYSTSSSISFL
jgi:hypothetical protein